MKVIGTDFKEYTIEPRADLSGAHLTKTNLRGAVWNGETVFPKGFEIPERVGLRRSRWRFWIMKITGTDGKEVTWQSPPIQAS